MMLAFLLTEVQTLALLSESYRLFSQKRKEKINLLASGEFKSAWSILEWR